MNAPLQAVHLAVRGDAMDAEQPSEESEDEVSQDDAARILAQIADLRVTIDKLTGKVSDALRDAQTAIVELYGVAGNPGISQQAAELRATLAAVQREIEAAGRHATSMLELALGQQAQQAESLRASIRGVETNLHSVRDAIDDRLRDMDAEVGVRIDAASRDLIERLDASERSIEGRVEGEAQAVRERFTDVNSFIRQAQEQTKLRNGAILITCVALTVWSLFGIWLAIKGPG